MSNDTHTLPHTQGRLQPQVEGLSPRALEARLLGQMTSFLAASNTKVNGGLFLDSMDRTDYDPFSGKTQALRVHTGESHDPHTILLEGIESRNY